MWITVCVTRFVGKMRSYGGFDKVLCYYLRYSYSSYSLCPSYSSSCLLLLFVSFCESINFLLSKGVLGACDSTKQASTWYQIHLETRNFVFFLSK